MHLRHHRTNSRQTSSDEVICHYLNAEQFEIDVAVTELDFQITVSDSNYDESVKELTNYCLFEHV